MLYPFLRPLLFGLDAEKSHTAALHLLKQAHKFKLTYLAGFSTPRLPVKVMDMTFTNPVGLAAGVDKNGAYIDALASFGFGFLELGTVTPRPQIGNPKPRLFRLPEHQAIINRMGFNNLGVDNLVKNLQNSRFQGIIGINIGKNADTPIEDAHKDYLECFDKVYRYANYIVINISSPNTQNLRQLQGESALASLLDKLKTAQHHNQQQYRRYVPFAVKIAPDLSATEIEAMSHLFLKYEIDAVVATNTTLDRTGIANHPHQHQIGGLSGAPLHTRSNEIIATLYQQLQENIPIIGAGGIMTPQDAVTKIQAGAKLIQLYSGLVYRGPLLVKESVEAIRSANLTSFGKKE